MSKTSRYTTSTTLQHILASCIVVAMLVVTGCTKDNDPVDPSGSDNYIYGVVTATDEFGNPVADRSGADITATASNGVVYRAKTASDGTWRLYDLPSEVYRIQVGSPEYDARSGVDSMDNVQYNGHGAYRLQEFRLMKMLSSAVSFNPTVDIEWRYIRDGHDTSVIDDSVANITLTFSTRSRSKQFSEIVQYAMSPDDDCSEVFGSAYFPPVRTDSTRTFNVNSLFTEAKKKFGDNVRGRTMYIHIRPSFSVYDPSTQKFVNPCVAPVVVPVTF